MCRKIFTGLFLMGLVTISFGQNVDSLLSKHEKITELGQNLYAVYDQKFCAVFDSNQEKFITHFRFTEVAPFYGIGLARCRVKEGRKEVLGLINQKGEIVLSDNDITYFEEILVNNSNKDSYDMRFQFINASETSRKEDEDFTSYLIFETNAHLGLIDSTGKVVIPAEYSEIWNENYGFVGVRKEDKYGLIKASNGRILQEVTLSENEFSFHLNKKMIQYQLDYPNSELKMDTTFHKNGQIKSIKGFKGGLQNGVTLEFGWYGQLINKTVYEHGEPIEIEKNDFPKIVFKSQKREALDFIVSQSGKMLLTYPKIKKQGDSFTLYDLKREKVITKIPIPNDKFLEISRKDLRLTDTSLFVLTKPNQFIIVDLKTGTVKNERVVELPYIDEDQFNDIRLMSDFEYNSTWLTTVIVKKAYKTEKISLDLYAKNVVSKNTFQLINIDITKLKWAAPLIEGEAWLDFNSRYRLLKVNYHEEDKPLSMNTVDMLTFNGKKIKSIFTLIDYEESKKKGIRIERTTSLFKDFLLFTETEISGEKKVSRLKVFDFKRKKIHLLDEKPDLESSYYPFILSSEHKTNIKQKKSCITHDGRALFIANDYSNIEIQRLEGSDNGIYNFNENCLIDIINGQEIVKNYLDGRKKIIGTKISQELSIDFYKQEQANLQFLVEVGDGSELVKYEIDLSTGQLKLIGNTESRGESQTINNQEFYKEIGFTKSTPQLLKHESKRRYTSTIEETTNYTYLNFYNKNKRKYLNRHVNFRMFENNEYIFYTPDGYYMGSKGIGSQIYFEEGLKLYPFEQFDLKYNRPDIILDRLGYADRVLISAYYAIYQKRLKKMGFTEELLKDDFNLPQIKIDNELEIPTQTDSSEIDIKLNMNDERYPLDRINIWVNDVAIHGTNGISIKEKNFKKHAATYSISLAKGDNKIQVSVLNQVGAESYKETIYIKCTAGKTQPDLYLVTIGAGKFLDTDFDLNYAAKDAQDVAKTLESSPLYENVFKKSLLNNQVTKENVFELQSFLSQAEINDQIILFIAGHGILDVNFDYYFATYDIDFTNPSQRGLLYSDLERLLDGIKPLKKTLIIDACHSGEIDKDNVFLAYNESEEDGEILFRSVGNKTKPKLGTQNSVELATSLFTDLRKGTGATVISSAGGMEFAMEGDNWKNGLFTYCLLLGLRSEAADSNGDGEIWFSELRKYVETKVFQLSDGKQRPTTRIENQSVDFRIW